MSPQSHPRPARPLDPTPLLSFDIDAHIAQLKEETEWDAAGRNAITLVKERNLRVVLLALQRGVRLDEHHAAGPFTLHVISGKVLLRARGKDIHVPAGGLVVLGSAVVHELEALEESAFLLTIVHPPRRPSTRPKGGR